MSCRRSAPFALVCLMALFAGGCDRSQDTESPVALGTYSMDYDASSEATLPVWQAAMDRRVDKEIADLVASPPVMIKEMRAEQAKTRKQNVKLVPHKISQIEVELTLLKGKKFELSTQIPEVSEDSCGGLWTIKDDELYLVRDTVDGQKLETKSSLRLSMGVDTLTLKWPGLQYMLVLKRG